MSHAKSSRGRSSGPHIALFDMDRTLVRVETASLYVRYQREIGEADWRDAAKVAWWVALYTFNMLDGEKVAREVLMKLRGMSETALCARTDDWFARFVERHVSDQGRERVAQHLARGDIVALATSATVYAARPLAKRLGIPHIIGTVVETENGIFTGVPLVLTYGKGKLEAAKQFVESHGGDLQHTTFYTDSSTDLPLLETVGNPVAVNPDPALLKHARGRRWPIERW